MRDCALCNAHGFLVTGKKAAIDGTTTARQHLSKHSLLEFSFALALPDHHAETMQLMTRIGDSKEDGQMLMRMTARSGASALCIRYKCAGIGLDTDKWTLMMNRNEGGDTAPSSPPRAIVCSVPRALSLPLCSHTTDRGEPGFRFQSID